jgi:hypothetical protein
VAENEFTKLVDFLDGAGHDKELQDAFWESEFLLDDPERYRNFWDNPRRQELLNRNGFRSLKPAHQDLVRRPRNLPKLQEAVEAELSGEPWPYDVGAHQHTHVSIGPCWVLVRV